MIDIRNDVAQIIGYILSIIGNFFSQMDNIYLFLGVTVLDFTIVVFLLSVIIPIVINVKKSESIKAYKNARKGGKRG